MTEIVINTVSKSLQGAGTGFGRCGEFWLTQIKVIETVNDRLCIEASGPTGQNGQRGRASFSVPREIARDLANRILEITEANDDQDMGSAEAQGGAVARTAQ